MGNICELNGIAFNDVSALDRLELDCTGVVGGLGDLVEANISGGNNIMHSDGACFISLIILSVVHPAAKGARNVLKLAIFEGLDLVGALWHGELDG